MSTKSVSELKIDDGSVTVILTVDKSYLSPGDIVIAQASYSQKGGKFGLFETSECVITTPVTGPLEILDTEETCIPSDNDSKLSVECKKIYRYFPTSMEPAIMQASGVFISHDKQRHHIITDPALIKVRKHGRVKRESDY
jgi:hypothetical protein